MLSIKTRQIKKTNKKPIISFVFLSLVLILLCFFIFLFSISSFEKSKVSAVRASLKNAFLSDENFHPTKASFEANSVQVFHQEQIKKIFLHSSIKQNTSGIFVLFDEKDIFKETSDELSPTINAWTKQIKSLLKISSLRQKYMLEIIFFEDIKMSEDYPIYQHLLTKRITKLTDKLDKEKIEYKRIRIEKGNADKIIVSFKKKEAL